MLIKKKKTTITPRYSSVKNFAAGKSYPDAREPVRPPARPPARLAARPPAPARLPARPPARLCPAARPPLHGCPPARPPGAPPVFILYA